MPWYDPFGIGDFIKEDILGLPSEKERRQQNRMIKEQIDEYKKQTELLRKETDAKREQVAAEKRRVNEKQIRLLRNRYRGSGGLIRNRGPAQRSQMTPLSNELSNQLGA